MPQVGCKPAVLDVKTLTDELKSVTQSNERLQNELAEWHEKLAVAQLKTAKKEKVKTRKNQTD